MSLQTYALPARATPWQDSVALAQIDPASGCNALNLTLTGDIFLTAAIQSAEPAASAFNVIDSGTVDLSRPDRALILSAAPTASVFSTLAAFAGAASVDAFKTASGEAVSSVTLTPGQTASPTVALLLGTGTVQLPVSATSRVSATGPGNFDAQFTSAVSATVSLSALAAAPGSPAAGATQSVGGVGSVSPIAPITGSVTQSIAIADAPTGWARNLVFNGFDASLGELVGYSVSVSADSNGTTAAENLEPAPAAFAIDQVATVHAVRPDGSDYAADASRRSLAVTLGAYDGAADFAGPSGVTALTGFVPTLRPQGILLNTQPSDLARFTAGGPVAIPVMSQGQATVTGPGNLDMVSTLQAGAVVSLTYDYAAPPVPAAPFTPAQPTLTVAPNQSVTGVQGFGPGDAIDATGIAFDGATRASLTTDGVLTLSGGAASTTIGFTAGSGLTAGNLRLGPDASGAGVSITYDPASLSILGGADAASAYVGPVPGLQNQYIALTAQNVAVAATTDGWFLHGSAGQDALVAHGGRNVLDGGGGSDLLVGGSGQDTFFVVATPGAPTWSTILGAHAGDDATMFGIVPAEPIVWQDGLGAVGFTGLTGTITDPAGGRTSLTLNGFTTADLANGRLVTSYGQVGSIPYLHIGIN